MTWQGQSTLASKERNFSYRRKVVSKHKKESREEGNFTGKTFTLIFLFKGYTLYYIKEKSIYVFIEIISDLSLLAKKKNKG